MDLAPAAQIWRAGRAPTSRSTRDVPHASEACSNEMNLLIERVGNVPWRTQPGMEKRTSGHTFRGCMKRLPGNGRRKRPPYGKRFQDEGFAVPSRQLHREWWFPGQRD